MGLFKILLILIKIVVLTGLLSVISFCLMTIGLVPSERFCEYMRNHKNVQIIFGIFIGIGLFGAFVFVC